MLRKIENDENQDQDRIADAMKWDSSQCCPQKTRKKLPENKKRRRAMTHVSSDEDSDDSNWNTHRGNKKKPKTHSDSDGDKNDSDNSKTSKNSAPQAPHDFPKSTADAKATTSNFPPKKVAEPKPKQAAPAPKPTIVSKKDKPSRSYSTTIEPVVPISQPDETDCTPDLFSFLVNHSFEQTHGPQEQPDNSVSSSIGANSSAPTPNTPQPVKVNASNAIPGIGINPAAVSPAACGPRGPPPVRTRMMQTTVVKAKGAQSSTTPIYHNYDGFRIDLNTASNQSTIRLPNGKVIHVQKQAPLGQPGKFVISTPAPAMAPAPVVSQLRPQTIQRLPTASHAPRPMVRVQQLRPLRPSQPPPLVINNGNPYAIPPVLTAQPRVRMPTQRPGDTPGHIPLHRAQVQVQMMQQNQVLQPVNQTMQKPAAALNALPTPRTYANDAVGRARTQLEGQVINTIQICHQIDSKLKTLMNSNAYKNVEKMPDIKELYIHLSYLLTYTKGRFQSVQDKSMENMRRLGFANDASSLSSGNVIDKYGSDVDEDDLEIVEPDHQTINLDSDEERTPEKGRKSKINSPQVIAKPDTSAPLPASRQFIDIENDSIRDISSSTENIECDVDISSLLQINMNMDDDENGDSLLIRMNDDVGIATPPDTEDWDKPNIENDIKLQSKAQISLTPAESEYPDLMKQALEKLNETQTPSNEDQEKAKSPTQSQVEQDKTDGNTTQNENQTDNDGEKINGNLTEINENGENMKGFVTDDIDSDDKSNKDKQDEVVLVNSSFDEGNKNEKETTTSESKSTKGEANQAEGSSSKGEIGNEAASLSEDKNSGTSAYESCDESTEKVDKTTDNDETPDKEDEGSGKPDTQTSNETELIYSDLNDCNQLIADEISQSTGLEVDKLLENDDFENISSPDTFN